MPMNRVTAAIAAGKARQAFAAGKTLADCPYATKGTPQARFQARYWLLAFQAAQHAAQQETKEASAGR